MRNGKNFGLAQVVLEVDDPWRYDGYVVDKKKHRVDILIAHVRGRCLTCPDCGAANRPRARHQAQEVAAPARGRSPKLHRGPRYLRQMRQGPAGGGVLSARPKSRMTRQMEALLVSRHRRSSVRGVALDFDVSDHRVWRAIRHHVDKAREKADHGDVRTVGIDETSTRERRRGRGLLMS